MFLFSWFKHPRSRLYICLKVALCARLLRCKSLATPFCPTTRLASFYMATCWIALVLLIAKFLHCRGNEVVALQTSAILLPRLLPGSRDAASFCNPPQAFQRRGNGVVALRSSAFLQPETHTWIPGPQLLGTKKMPTEFPWAFA